MAHSRGAMVSYSPSWYLTHGVQFSSVAQLCPGLANSMGHSTGLPVYHQLLEVTQTHVH